MNDRSGRDIRKALTPMRRYLREREKTIREPKTPRRPGSGRPLIAGTPQARGKWVYG